jgi:hypothetical protein
MKAVHRVTKLNDLNCKIFSVSYCGVMAYKIIVTCYNILYAVTKCHGSFKHLCFIFGRSRLQDSEQRRAIPRLFDVFFSLWWYRYELPDTHNAHAHAQLYVYAALFLRIRTMSATGRSLAAAPNRVTHWHHFSVPSYTRNSVSVFISLRCMDDKISWLGGWASQWRPPQILAGKYGDTTLN